ncbi:hypothetical protein SLH46_03705 [Draconibacterium sp. IB214405]|uniref:hypothetical protein n=1 Tax=Draconibacterium sp. IB214405 TaxID=3097352 RepID=UPI002A0CBEDF|nr:hypothetical protein [Draconibacterium sp. IB214405]MDX8338276.1 hypothetical protein [Draconibacterium sp. IB214405]
MSLLKYSNTEEKTIHVNSDVYIDSFKKKIQETLRDFEAQSEIENDTIKFKRIVRSTTHSGQNKIEAMKLVREGLIRIERIDSTKIRIFWEVKLDAVLFLSVSIGLLIGLIAGFAGSMILISTIIGLLFSAIMYFVGCSIVKSKINELITSSY